MAFESYNEATYNEQQYNLGDIFFFAASETPLSMSDVFIGDYFKIISDAVGLIDEQTASFTETLYQDEIRLNDWLSIRRNPQLDKWSD